MRRLFLTLLKAAVSILLLYLSFRSVNIGAVAERLSRIDASWLALALGLLAIQIALLAARWREIVRACGAPLAFGAALQISFIAMFFNQVLPSTIGGDAARIWLLARKCSDWATATYSVLIDRIIGVLMLALIVIVCLPWTLEIIRDPVARAVLILIGCGALAGAVVFILVGMAAWQTALDRWMPTRHLAAASRAARHLLRSPSSVTTVAACSVAIHVLTVTVAWCCVKAVAAPVEFAQVLFLMPPVLLVATVPLSIAGWGVRESSMVVAFAYAGLAQGDGLILSILFGIVSFALGAAGGLVWIASGLSMRAFARTQVNQASVSEP